MDQVLSKQINYWLTCSSKHDCFFIIGQQDGQKERIGAIKVLLMGHSDVFQKMLDESPLAETGDIHLTDSDPETFKNFLKCLYGGTDIVIRYISYEKCLSLLYLCEKYLTSDLKAKIISLILQLHQPLSVSDVLISLVNPSLLEASESLCKAVTNIVQKDTGSLFNHKSFLELDSNGLTFILKQDKLSIQEIDVWKAVIKWVRNKTNSKDPKVMRSYFGNSIGLKYIRFCAMKAIDFCEHVVPSEILTPEEVFVICSSIGTKTTPRKLTNEICTEVNSRYEKRNNHEITFTYVLNEVRVFNGSEYSPKFKAGKFNWNIGLRKNENHLGIFLYCSGVDTKSGKCSVDAEFELVNHSGGSNRTRIFSKDFCLETCPNWGFEPFMSFEDLLDIKKGFLKNDGIQVITHVKAVSE